MSTERQLRVSQSPTGRIALHLLALNRDRKFRWHWAGILREVRALTNFATA